jgi:predicted methyltransferase
VELRTYLKERRFHANAFRFRLLSPYGRMYHYIAHPGNGLDLRNIPDGIREAVSQRRKSREISR